MIREIAAAVGFISKFLRTKGLMNERQLQTFSQCLQELLAGEGGVGAAGAAPSPPRAACPGRAGGGAGGTALRGPPEWGKGEIGPSEVLEPLCGGDRRPVAVARPLRGSSVRAGPGGCGRQERAVNKRGSGVAQAAPPPTPVLASVDKAFEQPGLELCAKGSNRPVSTRKNALKLDLFVK